MKRFIFAAIVLLPSLSACGGVGESNWGAVPQGASAPLAPDATVRPTQLEAAQLPAAPFLARLSSRLYVANAGNQSITVYQTGASGNTAPLAKIIGSNTQLNAPGQLSEDANGDLYVANRGSSSILVFAHGANGNVAPIRAIAGPSTGLSTNALETVTVDHTTGEIFAVAALAGQGAAELIRFPRDASGDQAPLAASGGVTGSSHELASDSTGKNIITASFATCCDSYTQGVETFGKQFPNGKAGKIYYIEAFANNGIADDPTTKTYLVSGFDGVTQGIFRFQEDTVGNGAYGGDAPAYTPGVVSVITSDTCGSQLALGYAREIYVAHSTYAGFGGGACATDAVYVYGPDASGNAKPLRVLSGSATGLHQPGGIYEGK